ncbi:hypothetical protein DAEQUDRAFT_814649 [Daedalea quercina L-15889]|uniref:PH domain-containing protein n=1 Tax=Daedalea quercina L-15889 TaxID=1314783 RepID=A0A165LWR4_9APHY|nr:hypothetical protein DAEQUDRAFT_814649 [Daedalea quercina L-15889]
MSRPTSPSISRPLVLATLDELPTPPRSRKSSLPATADPFTAHPTGSGSFVTYEPDNSSTGHSSPPPASMPLAMLPKRARGSLLMAASGLSFVRQKSKSKKPPAPVAQSPFVFSEVIEISAPHKDDDDEERDRLRDAAAQSIGLDPVLLAEERSLSEPEVPEDTRTGSSTPTPAPPSELPGFPSTRSALEPFVQLTGRMAKHYPAPSLLKLALARQWKYRVLVLTSAAQGSACLHVFKTGVPDERELERQYVCVDTVVFVAEEDVGGRRGVIRVGRTDSTGTDMALHMADSAQAQEWIAAIKQAVLNQRSVRAGLGLMVHSPGGFEPRGDMDVMLSMRAQGMLSSPTSSTFSPDVPSAPLTQRSASAAGTRSPSGAVSALRGLFSSQGNRPRSPSMASTRVDSEDSESQHDDSFGRAGTSLLGMLRSQSVASERPVSPVNSMGAGGVSASVPTTPRQADTQLPLPYTHLDRKILQDKDLDLIESKPSSGGSDVHALLRGRAPLSMATLRATPAPATTPPPLQPPPRRRGYTIGGTPIGARSRPETGPANAYTHANGSTAESFGLRTANMGMLFAPSPPAPSSRPGSSGGHAEGKPRTSLSSLSSYASYASYASNERRASSEAGHSNGHANGNANGSINAKRWSRQGTLPHRLTPPEGALPAPPVPTSTHGSPRSIASLPRHPYAAEASPQSVGSDSPQSFVFMRDSSRRDTSPLSSSSSPQSFVLNLREFSRRASSSSARSTSSVSTSHSRATTSNGGSLLGHGHRPRSSHRASMPPPQRPAPLTALPPTPSAAPSESDSPPKSPSSAPSHKTTFRESLVLRRLSMSPPSMPPPSSSLPPRPDESAYRHRRSLSNGSPLTPIPASPGVSTPASGSALPFPPPNGPLPSTPEAHTTPTSAQTSIPTPTQDSSKPPPLSRVANFRQRIRGFSAPSQAPLLNLPPPSPTPSTVNPYSVPSTPIGEPIAPPDLQNDPSFVSSASIPPPSQPPPVSAFTSHPFAVDDHEHGVTSLSPPPRRGSRRVSRFPEEESDDSSERDKPRPSTADAAGDAGRRQGSLSLSPRTSAVSLINLHST